jgi:hypothetical protein
MDPFRRCFIDLVHPIVFACCEVSQVRIGGPCVLLVLLGEEKTLPQKIKDVIVSGSVLGRAPIVSMPHWGGILTQADLDALVAYLSTLQ